LAQPYYDIYSSSYMYWLFSEPSLGWYECM